MKILDRLDFLIEENRNKTNVKLLTNSIEHRDISHAYLFYGNSIALLYRLALSFSASINCQLGGCGSCTVCKNTLKGVYPNLNVVEAEGNILTIDKIVELQRFINMSSYMPGKKICIIKNAEIMNDQASNRLLKTLEEPPGGSIFILLTEDISSILPTVVSRCLVFNWNFKLSSGDITATDFTILGSSLDEGIKRMVKSPQRTYTIPLNLCSEIISILKGMEKDIKIDQEKELKEVKSSGENRDDISKYLKILKSKHKRQINKFYKLGINYVFDIISAWLTDIQAVKLNVEDKVLNHRQNYFFIKENFRNVKIDKTFQLLETIEKNRDYLNFSIYLELALDNIFLQFQNLCYSYDRGEIRCN